MLCMYGNDFKTNQCHEECKIIYEAMKFVRNVLVLHCKVLPPVLIWDFISIEKLRIIRYCIQTVIFKL